MARMSCYRLDPSGFTAVPTSFWTPSMNLESDLARLARERQSACPRDVPLKR
jgi:hypothetical protein